MARTLDIGVHLQFGGWDELYKKGHSRKNFVEHLEKNRCGKVPGMAYDMVMITEFEINNDRHFGLVGPILEAEYRMVTSGIYTLKPLMSTYIKLFTPNLWIALLAAFICAALGLHLLS